jgi:hypothetical protein
VTLRYVAGFYASQEAFVAALEKALDADPVNRITVTWNGTGWVIAYPPKEPS